MRTRDGEGSRRRPAAQPGQVRHCGVALNPDLPDLTGAGLLGSNVVGVGVDLVDTDRFAAVIARSPRLVARVFTDREVASITHAARRATSLAARWAAKEAVAKVLVDCAGLEWHDCEVLVGDHGEPRLEVRGTVAAASQLLGIDDWHLSLSHDGDTAIAFVVATTQGGAR